MGSCRQRELYERRVDVNQTGLGWIWLDLIMYKTITSCRVRMDMNMNKNKNKARPWEVGRLRYIVSGRSYLMLVTPYMLHHLY